MGAVAVVVADPQLQGDTLLTMSASRDDGESGIRIPSVFISSNSYAYIRSLSGVPALADLADADIRLLAMHLRDPVGMGPYAPIRERTLGASRLHVKSGRPRMLLYFSSFQLTWMFALICRCFAHIPQLRRMLSRCHRRATWRTQRSTSAVWALR